jgi:hypothetical protein
MTERTRLEFELPDAVAMIRGVEVNAGEKEIVTVLDDDELDPTLTNCCWKPG